MELSFEEEELKMWLEGSLKSMRLVRRKGGGSYMENIEKNRLVSETQKLNEYMKSVCKAPVWGHIIGRK